MVIRGKPAEVGQGRLAGRSLFQSGKQKGGVFIKPVEFSTF